MASLHARANKGYTNCWNKPTHVEYECDDQVCYPVVDDIIGMRHSPIRNNYHDNSDEIYTERVIHTTTPYNAKHYDNYGTIDHGNQYGSYGFNPRGYPVAERVETIIEHVHVPTRTHVYPNHSNPKLESIKEYKVSERPISPVYHDYQYPNEGLSYTHKYQPKPFPLLDADNWHNVSHKKSTGQLSGASGKIETLVDYLKDASYAEDIAHNYARKY